MLVLLTFLVILGFLILCAGCSIAEAGNSDAVVVIVFGFCLEILAGGICYVIYG